MNIFVLDQDPKLCAEYHCDEHVVKMILEHAQMMSTAIRVKNQIETEYKQAHLNHPATKWVRESSDNYEWLLEMTHHLHAEWQKRYKHSKSKHHKSYDVILRLPKINAPSIGLTKRPQCMPDQYKRIDPVEAYRLFYIHDKPFATWRLGAPEWYMKEAA